MFKMIEVDERLKSIADMIYMADGGRDAVVADIGSDHAYLPVWMYINKKIKKAFAADISINSVVKIKRNIERYNISPDIIVPVLSDGLAAFECECEFTNKNNLHGLSEITHIVIAGMGGNNISRIIDESFIAKEKILILQPNTKTEFLRKFLYDNNFDIKDENLAIDNEHLYISIRTEYIGDIDIAANKNIDLLDIIIGRHIIQKKSFGYRKYILRQIKRLKNILNDLDAKDKTERENINTTYGKYRDIENLIVRIENL